MVTGGDIIGWPSGKKGRGARAYGWGGNPFSMDLCSPVDRFVQIQLSQSIHSYLVPNKAGKSGSRLVWCFADASKTTKGEVEKVNKQRQQHWTDKQNCVKKTEQLTPITWHVYIFAFIFCSDRPGFGKKHNVYLAVSNRVADFSFVFTGNQTSLRKMQFLKIKVDFFLDSFLNNWHKFKAYHWKICSVH